MKRRLFFLLPDIEHTKEVVFELNQIGIDQSHMHVIARDDIDTTNLPRSTPRQKQDGIYKIEQFMWNANLAIFAIALFFALFLLLTDSPLAAIIPACIMLICFACGYLFITKLPSAHLSEFETSLSHGEILLVVNTPKENVQQLENHIHHRHPEAITAGIGWTIEAFHL